MSVTYTNIRKATMYCKKTTDDIKKESWKVSLIQTVIDRRKCSALHCKIAAPHIGKYVKRLFSHNFTEKVTSVTVFMLHGHLDPRMQLFNVIIFCRLI